MRYKRGAFEGGTYNTLRIFNERGVLVLLCLCISVIRECIDEWQEEAAVRRLLSCPVACSEWVCHRAGVLFQADCTVGLFLQVCVDA